MTPLEAELTQKLVDCRAAMQGVLAALDRRHGQSPDRNIFDMVQDAARAARLILPEGYNFFIFAGQEGDQDGRRAHYVGDMPREVSLLCMREFYHANADPKTWGKHTL